MPRSLRFCTPRKTYQTPCLRMSLSTSIARRLIVYSAERSVIPGKALGYKSTGNIYSAVPQPYIKPMTNLVKDLPDWGEMPKRPGLYLSLSHGRDFPQQTMRGRGFPGPKLGPILYVHTHYGQEVTVRFATNRDAARFFPDTATHTHTLQVLEGTLVYGDKCFGDWDVCYVEKAFCARSN